MLVHTKSGFSKTAAEWGMLPIENIRLLPKYPTDFDTPWTHCPSSTFVRDYYQHSGT
jgi:hypothetical protein